MSFGGPGVFLVDLGVDNPVEPHGAATGADHRHADPEHLAEGRRFAAGQGRQNHSHQGKGKGEYA